MCLAIPSRIVKINDFAAVVDVYGARREVSLLLMPEEVGVGDYVLVHAGFAIQKMEQESALDSLRVISSIVDQLEEDDDDEEFAPP